MELEALEAVVGTTFAGGTHTIEPYEHWLGCDAMAASPQHDDVAHPLFAYIAGLTEMGLSLEQLFQLVGSSSDDGVLFGQTEIEVFTPLRVGTTYAVSGKITSVARKSGRQTGTFDIVTFRLELRTASGTVAAATTNSFIFPRKSL